MFENLGEVAISDDLSIGTTQYGFEISARMSLDDAQNIIAPAIGIYAGSDVEVKQISAGWLLASSDYVFTFTPSTVMKLSDWRAIFDSIFASYGTSYTLKNVDVGKARAFDAPEPSVLSHPLQNMETYYAPVIDKISNFGKGLVGDLSSVASYVKVVAIAGAVIVGGVLALNYLPKPRYQENPKRRRHYRKSR